MRRQYESDALRENHSDRREGASPSRKLLDVGPHVAIARAAASARHDGRQDDDGGDAAKTNDAVWVPTPAYEGEDEPREEDRANMRRRRRPRAGVGSSVSGPPHRTPTPPSPTPGPGVARCGPGPSSSASIESCPDKFQPWQRSLRNAEGLATCARTHAAALIRIALYMALGSRSTMRRLYNEEECGTVGSAIVPRKPPASRGRCHIAIATERRRRRAMRGSRAHIQPRPAPPPRERERGRWEKDRRAARTKSGEGGKAVRTISGLGAARGGDAVGGEMRADTR